MPVVTLNALQTMLGAPGPIGRGLVSVVYWAGAGPVTRVDGADVVFPQPITVQIVNGEPSMPLALEPTGGLCCTRWTVQADGLPALVRMVEIPDVDEVDFGDLVDVDPSSFAPVDPTPTLVETIRSTTAAQLVAGANVTITPDGDTLEISASGGGGGGAVSSVNEKTGDVVLTASDVGAATEAQGELAETAVQPGDLGSVASHDVSEFATAAQGGKADSALQSVPDATTTAKGAVQLAGDLAGSAASPTVAKLAGATVAGTPGSPDGTTAFFGDGTWKVPSGGGGLSGTGSPEGVVTASVGAVYTDTAATGGMIQWIKASGTGNTGWIVLAGDTGWRQLASGTTDTGPSGFLRMRVQDRTVKLWALIHQNTTAGFIAQAPVGWRAPGGTTIFPGMRPGTTNIGGLGFDDTSGNFKCYNGTNVTNQHFWASWPQYGSANWSTLPGTAYTP